MIRFRLLKRALLQLLFLGVMIISSFLGYGQFSTISTLPTFTADNGSGIVTFNIHNTNAYPIVIDTIYFQGNNTNINIVSYLWAKNTPVNGQPTSPINADPNWTLVHSQYTTSLGSNLQQPFLTGINFIIPPNTEMGLAVGGFLGTDVNSPGSGYMRYYTIPSANPINTFTTNGVDIVLGNNISYGATSFTSAPTHHPRGFVGSIVFSPLLLCTEVTAPAGWEILSSANQFCTSSNLSLHLSEIILGIGTTYIFQSSLDGENWNNINSPSSNSSININNISQNTYFRALWLCDDNIVDSTSSILIAVGSPEITQLYHGENCGSSSLTLGVDVAHNEQVAWFDDVNSSQPIHIGSTLTTPFLTTSQTYYAIAYVGSYTQNQGGTIGSGNTITTGTPQPFYTTYWGNKNQYLIRASELLDAGYTSGSIKEVVFDVVAASGLPLNNFTIKMGHTSNTVATTSFIQSLTTVYSSSVPEVLTANSPKVFVLDDNFIWDGVSNIIIETCFNNSSWSSGHSVRTTNVGFYASTYQYGDNNNVCSNNSGYTSQVRPNITLIMEEGCTSSKEEVHAIIHPDINLNIPTNYNLCIEYNEPIQLDAGEYPNNVSYLWDDNSTGRFREVVQSGTYSVTVSNEFGCSASTDINVTIKHNPEVDLGPDTTLCLGGSIQLDAGPDGAAYSWSNGIATRYNQITMPGTYTVMVAAPNGCAVLDTIVIAYSDQEIASFDGIHAEGIGSNTFKFEAISPQNITDYLWHFGDGNTSTTPIPTHTYANNGNYIVTLDASNECGMVSDSIPTHIISIGEKNKDKNEITIYPNPTNGKIIIKNDAPLPMKEIAISDALGRELTTIHIKDHSQQFIKEIDLSPYATGIYWINIKNDQTSYSRKIQLIK